jgi:hypothetical protein
VVITGGMERTQEEFAALFQAAGFRLARIAHTPAPACVIEGVPD